MIAVQFVRIMILLIALSVVVVAADFELVATAKGERYCRVDSQVSSMLVAFNFTLRNDGSSDLVIQRPVYPLLLVSRTLNDVRRGKHEFELHAPDVFGASESREDRHSINDEQYIAKAGQVLEGETMEVTVPIPSGRKFSTFEALTPGTHYVQLVIDGHNGAGPSVVRLISRPLRIVVPTHPALSKCD